MSIYDIREAKITEGIDIQQFLDNYWKKNHSLAVSRELLDFQHLNKEDDHYNYVVAMNTKTGEMDAIFGYIPTYQYDPALRAEGDYWAAIWKKREDVENEESNEIGMDVFTRIFDYPNFHSFSAIGISAIAMRIYKAFQCTVGYLSQYYILNDRIHDFKIAGNVKVNHIGPAESYTPSPDWNVSEIDSSELESLHVEPVYRPFKSIDYLINRYAKHPIYQYRFLGVYEKGNITTVLVTRWIETNGATVIRIVDVLGQLQGSLFESFQHYLHETGAEYIDLMNYGISEDLFMQMGFRKLDLNGSLIIPNYFEPFEQCNIKIDIAWKADYDHYVAFKGDSDQDRPNIL